MSILSFFNVTDHKTHDDDFIETLEIEDGIEDEFYIWFCYYVWRNADLTEKFYLTDFGYECAVKYDKAKEEALVKEAIVNWFWKEFGASITFEL